MNAAVMRVLMSMQSQQKPVINLYPNPSAGILSIQTEETVKFCRLFNDLEAELNCKLTNGDKIDIIGLSVGVYILEINTSSGTVRKKIIKE